MKDGSIEKVSTISASMSSENLEKLRGVFPQFVRDGEIDFDALKAFFADEGALAGTERYGLNWAGKSDAFRAIRTPATGTLVPQVAESKEWDTTGNLFIEGDNLEVLKLLQRHYRGAVKMIYIDPPYNTGKDFIYKDNFVESQSDYYERTGQAEGGVKLTSNPESNGRYHSDWLTMIYPRLFLARNLLRDDGVIFISIDDHEVANLRLVMDEIFGEENFISTFMWKRKKEVSNDSKNVAVQGEYVLCYSRTESTQLKLESLSDEYIDSSYSEATDDFPLGKWRPVPITVSKGLSGGGYTYKITTPSGTVHDRIWAYPEESFKNLLEEKRVYFGKGGDGIPQRVIYESESNGKPTSNYWDSISTNKEGKKEILEIFGDSLFDTPKPTTLIKKMLTLVTEKKDELILDFFAGSGTTTHAVMAQNAEDGGNRKWICVQLPEETAEDSEARKAGFKTIADISRERIRRASDSIREDVISKKVPSRRGLQEVYGHSDREIGEMESDAVGDLDFGFKSLVLAQSNYRQWQMLTADNTEQDVIDQAKLFAEKPLVDGYDEQSLVYEVLLKEGFDLNAHVAQETIGDIKLWRITSGEKVLIVTFAPHLTQDQAQSLGLKKEDPQTLVCLDSALDDTTKVNIARNLNLKVI